MFKLMMSLLICLFLMTSMSGYAQKVPQGTIMDIPDIDITVDKISKYCPGDMDFEDLKRQFVVAKLKSPVTYQPVIQNILEKCNPEVIEIYLFKSSTSEEFKTSSTAVIELMGLLDGYTKEHSSKFTDTYTITRPVFNLLQPSLTQLSSTGNLLCFSNFTNVSFIPIDKKNNKDNLGQVNNTPITTDCNNLQTKFTETIFPKDTQSASEKIIKVVWTMQGLALWISLLFICIGVSLVIFSYKTESSLSMKIRDVYKRYLEDVFKKIGIAIGLIFLIICSINMYNLISSVAYTELVNSNKQCNRNSQIDYNCVFMNTQRKRVLYDLSVSKASNLPTFYDVGSIDRDKLVADFFINPVTTLQKLWNQFIAYLIAFGIFLIILYFIISFVIISTVSYFHLLAYFIFSHFYFIFKTNPQYLFYKIRYLLSSIFLFGFVNTASLIIIFFTIQYQSEIGGIIGLILGCYILYLLLMKRQVLFIKIKQLTGFADDPKYINQIKQNQLAIQLKETQQAMAPTYVFDKAKEKANQIASIGTTVVANYKSLKDTANKLLTKKKK